MPFIIRPGVPDDAPSLAEINIHNWQTAFRGVVPDAALDGLNLEAKTASFREGLAGRTTPPARVLVAEVDGRVVGFVAWGTSRDPDVASDTGEVYAIYVRQEHWGQGIGSALLSDAVASLARDGFARATLWTLAELPRTIRFYKAAGFEQDGKTVRIPLGGTRVAHVRLVASLSGSAAPAST
jgi:GNAT superfamily N-acetyltransferase